MFHITKQFSILDKDNMSKYLMQFLNDYFIYQEEKMSKPTWPSLKK